MNSKEEIHCKCFEPLIDSNSKILILGTMPGKMSLKKNEYYVNPNNCFWRIIKDLFNKGQDFKDYKEKCDCLKRNNIALWDVLATCEREGSSDANIENEIQNDITELLKKHPNIERIIFNGNKPQKKFTQKVHCYSTVATSTSGANTRNTYKEKLEIWSKLLKFN